MGVSPDHQEASLVFEETARYLINPGSVGQPRDENPRAGYAIYDHESRKVTLHRIDYPISGAQSRILEAGLPPILAERLAHGI